MAGRDCADLNDADSIDERRYGEVDAKHVLICGRILYELIIGDLADSKEETVVNSTGNDVCLTVSVAKALADKAGSGFITAATALAPLAEGNVGETEGFDMPCKQILHCNCPPYTQDKKPLKKIILLCLQKASDKRHHSIAFPAVGMGMKRYPANIVAESMVEAITEFSEQNAHSSITDVKLYQCEMLITPSQCEAFTGAMFKLLRRSFGFMLPSGTEVIAYKGDLVEAEGIREAGGSRRQIPEPDGFELPNDTKFEALKGDLAEAEVKAGIIVNFITSKEDSSALLRNGGPEMQDEYESQIPKNVGDIAVTNGYGLPCSAVLHAYCAHWETGGTEKTFQALISKCLNWTNDFDESSVAFLALSTEELGYPSEDSAICFLQASTDYAKNNPKSRVKRIMLVALPNDTNTIEGFENALGLKLNDQHHQVMRNNPAQGHEHEKGKVYPLPSTWVKPWDVCKVVTLERDEPEWSDVHANFIRTLENPLPVLQILRIQNPQLYKQYEIAKQSVARKLQKPERQVETRSLWHGTSEDNVHKIARSKFDRGLSGAVGENMLGRGSYFSTTSRYSNNFAPANDDGESFMIQANVITGQYCKGTHDLKQAPYKTLYEHYDSVVDDVSNPTMYAVFEDAAAYPEYIIKY